MMIAVKTQFDGHKILLPNELHEAAPQEVIVVFEGTGLSSETDERQLWLNVQEASLMKVWENDEDAVYDNL